MGFLDFFKPLKSLKQAKWKELGAYTAQFYPFGNDMYKSDIVRSCIRPLAEHTSKANAVCTNKAIERILNMSPNMYMNGKDFLYKTRTLLELRNTVFIYIDRDDKGAVKGFYPVPYSMFEGIEYGNRLYIKFYFEGELAREIVLPWADLVVLRKDYNRKDIAGDDNTPIIQTLELISTTNQGIANAVKATANLRGILKSTKAMLKREDIQRMKEEFVSDYMSLNNEGGIASLDATQEFTPIEMKPSVTNAETIKEFREDVYRYFGINDAIITSNYNYASNKTKLEMVALVDRGALTPNEWRAMFNLPPVDGGDVPIRRLDTAPTDEEKPADDEEGDKDEDKQ